MYSLSALTFGQYIIWFGLKQVGSAFSMPSFPAIRRAAGSYSSPVSVRRIGRITRSRGCSASCLRVE